MILKEKSWLWKLAGPFASNNYTTIWNTLYHPKGGDVDKYILAHEQIHSDQQHHFGRLFLPVWIWLYIVGIPFGLPILYNPFRWKWEFDAYTRGSQWTPGETRAILRSQAYGWLIFHSEGK